MAKKSVRKSKGESKVTIYTLVCGPRCCFLTIFPSVSGPNLGGVTVVFILTSVTI